MNTQGLVRPPVYEYRFATVALGAVRLGTIVQFTHWPPLTELQVTVANPVAGPGAGSWGLIISLYTVPPELKSTPSEQLLLAVRMFWNGTMFRFWSRQALYTSTFSQ